MRQVVLMRALLVCSLLLACSGPTGDPAGKDDTDLSDTDAGADSGADTDTGADPDSDLPVDTDDPVDPTTCPGAPVVSVDRCDVVAGDARLLLVGLVLAPDAELVGGQVLIEDGRITCVGCDCPAPGATTVTCGQGVISPGLINAHDHLTFGPRPFTDSGERYEHRHQWRRGTDGHTTISASGSVAADGVRWNELRQVMSGTTSIAGSGGAAGLARNLDRANLPESLASSTVRLETFPLGDSGGARRTADCAYPGIETPDVLDGLDAYLAHVAEGVDASARNELRCLTGAAGGEDLLGARTSIITGGALDAADLQSLAERGAGLVWSPRSNLALYGQTAQVAVALRLGVRVGLGTDWFVTGSMNMLRELRCADAHDDASLGDALTPRDLWRMATGTNAALTGTDDDLGMLAVGRLGDVAIYDGARHPRHEAVVRADPEDVVLVLRGGTALYGDAGVIEALRGEGTCDALDVCGSAHAVCLAGEVDLTLAELTASVGDAYPLFACGEPADEPTCVPQRSVSVDGSSTYTGQPGAGDDDGDGVPDLTDVCPGVFDPIRPVDAGAQADVDEDGVGDACDPCPVDASAVTCP